MIADSLFISWLRVVGIWWMAVLMWWGISNDAVLASFNALPDFFFKFTGEKCSLPGITCAEGSGPVISAANAIHYMGYLLSFWTFPVLGAVALSSSLGFGIAYVDRARANRDAEGRLNADEEWRGINISLGTLCKPVWSPEYEMVKVTFDSSIQTKLAALEPRHEIVLSQIFGLLKRNPEAFTGDGHKGSLLDHTIGVFERAVESSQEPIDPILPLAAAAHDIGKIRSHFKNKEGVWVQKRGNAGLHDYQGGLLVSSLPGFFELTPEEQTLLVVLTKYAHKPNRAPFPDAALKERQERLFDDFRKADKTVTAEEKAEVIEELKEEKRFDDIVLEAFLETITTFKWQDPNLPRSRRAIGWRKGNELILIEIEFRERFATMLPPEIVAAWGGAEKRKNDLAGLTKNFMVWLDQRGWLVKEIDVYKKHDDQDPFKREVCPPNHFPIWNIFSGDKEFRGVYTVRMPAEFAKKMPHETQFELKYFGYMKPPKSAKRAQKPGNSTKAEKRLQSRRKQSASTQQEEALTKLLEPQPQDIQAKVRKKLARYKAMGMYAVTGEDVLRSVLAEKDAHPKEKSAPAKNDPRAKMDAEKGTKPSLEVFTSLSSDKQKEARAMQARSLNAGTPMKLEDAAIAVRDGLSPTPAEQSKQTQEPTKGSCKQSATAITDDKQSGFPEPKAIVPGAFSRLEGDDKKLANKIFSVALNQKIKMTRDAAAALVNEGLIKSTAELESLVSGNETVSPASDAQENTVEVVSASKADLPDTRGKESKPEQKAIAEKPKVRDSKTDSRGESKNEADELWKQMTAEQNRQAVQLLQESLNSGQRPDRLAIARKVLAAAKSEEPVQPIQPKPTSQAGHDRGSDNSQLPAARKVVGKPKDAIPSPTIDVLTDEEKAEFRSRMNKALNAGVKFNRVEAIQDLIARRESQRKSPGESKADVVAEVTNESSAPEQTQSIAPEEPKKNRKRKRRKPRKKTASVNESIPETSGSKEVADSNEPFAVPASVPEPAPNDHATQNIKVLGVYKRITATEAARRMGVPAYFKNGHPADPLADWEGLKDSDISPVHTRPYGALSIKGTELETIEDLTPEEVLRVKKEFAMAVQQGKKGAAVNRVQIARRIIQERNVDQQKEKSKSAAELQYLILSEDSNSEDAVDTLSSKND